MTNIVQFYEIGDPSVLQIQSLPIRDPGPAEVRIRVDCFALNRSDILYRQGRYFEQPSFPSRLGYDAAGVVEAIGEGVSGLVIGECVFTIPAFSQGKYGVYGETAILPAHALVPYPSHLAPEEACTIGVQYFTGYFGLFEIGQLSAGQYVLITAASSGTGLAAIQLAKAQGAQVIATTRTSAKRQTLMGYGADHVIATQEENLPARVAEITGGSGVQLIYESLGGRSFGSLGEVVAPAGRIVVYGFLESSDMAFSGLPFYRKGVSVHFYQVFHFTGLPLRNLAPQTEAVERAKKFIVSQIIEGSLKPVIAKTFLLNQIVDAHRFMESNEQIGKIIVRPG